MNTEQWVAACPSWKPGTRVRATATSLTGANQGTEGEVKGKDPDFKGFYMVRWDGRKQNASVAWDSVELAESGNNKPPSVILARGLPPRYSKV